VNSHARRIIRVIVRHRAGDDQVGAEFVREADGVGNRRDLVPGAQLGGAKDPTPEDFTSSEARMFPNSSPFEARAAGFVEERKDRHGATFSRHGSRLGGRRLAAGRERQDQQREAFHFASSSGFTRTLQMFCMPPRFVTKKTRSPPQAGHHSAERSSVSRIG